MNGPLLLAVVYGAAGVSTVAATVIVAGLGVLLRWWLGFSDGRWPWI